MNSDTSNEFLKLHSDFCLFDGTCDVFYDRSNLKVITVKNDGSMGITARGCGSEKEKKDVVYFRVVASKKINFVAFSLDMNIVALLRDSKTVDLVFLDQKPSDDLYPIVTFSAKSKSIDHILSVHWVSERHIVLVTNCGIELFLVSSTKKKTVKFVRNSDVDVSWATFYPKSQLVICAGGIAASNMSPFIVQDGTIHKLHRFDVDFGISNVRRKLAECDVEIGSVYDDLYLLVAKSDAGSLTCTEINMYLISRDITKASTLSYTLVVDLPAGIGIHVVDNLVLVHQIEKASSLIFDVKFATSETCLPIFTTQIQVCDELAQSYGCGSLSRYPNFIFPPAQFVDVAKGVYSHMVFDFSAAKKHFTDPLTRLRFVLQRSGIHEHLLFTINDLIRSKSLTLQQVYDLFDEIYAPGFPKHLVFRTLTFRDISTKFRYIVDKFTPMRINQTNVLNEIFEPLSLDNLVDKKYLSEVLLQFLLLLKRVDNKPMSDYMPEILIRILSDAGSLEKLQLLLQHKIVDDSRGLAFRLIEIGKNSPTLDQLALDMLSRDEENIKEIIKIFVDRGQVIDAIRCFKDKNVEYQLTQKILEATWVDKNSRQTKFAVYSHLKNTLKLPFLNPPTEALQKYEFEFNRLFDDEEIEAAEFRFQHAQVSSSVAMDVPPSPRDASLPYNASEISFDAGLNMSFTLTSPSQ